MATGMTTEALFLGSNHIVLAAAETSEETTAASEEAHAEDGHSEEGSEAATHGDDASHGETDAHTEVAHGDEHGATGMPQLDVTTYSNQIFWLVLCLIAVYFLFSRIALPRIGGTIEQRTQTIQRDLDRAAEMKLKAEEAEEQYNQALSDARARAHAIAEETKAKIQGEVDAATAKADAEIAKQSEASAKRIAKLQKDAEASVQDVASDVAKSILDALAPSVSDAKSVKSALGKVLKG